MFSTTLLPLVQSVWSIILFSECSLQCQHCPQHIQGTTVQDNPATLTNSQCAVCCLSLGGVCVEVLDLLFLVLSLSLALGCNVLPCCRLAGISFPISVSFACSSNRHVSSECALVRGYRDILFAIGQWLKLCKIPGFCSSKMLTVSAWKSEDAQMQSSAAYVLLPTVSPRKRAQ